jgi:hypothetical protein
MSAQKQADATIQPFSVFTVASKFAASAPFSICVVFSIHFINLLKSVPGLSSQTISAIISAVSKSFQNPHAVQTLRAIQGPPGKREASGLRPLQRRFCLASFTLAATKLFASLTAWIPSLIHHDRRRSACLPRRWWI